MASMLDYLSTSTSIAKDLVAMFGIPYGIFAFMKQKGKEKKERESRTYNELDDKYFEFLKLNIQNPKLCINVTKEESSALSEIEKRQQSNLFFILVSILERAYILYRDDESEERKSQRDGWYEYMVYYGENETFRELWKVSGNQFDIGFMQHMDRIVRNNKVGVVREV